jgi:hypothetical protein
MVFAAPPSTAMLTSNLLHLFATTLAALANTLTFHPKQKAPIVLRAWRVVQTSQTLLRTAAPASTADLEALAQWIHWATTTVEDACAPAPKAMHRGSGRGAIHAALLAETDKVGAWLSAVQPVKLEPTQTRMRAWKLGLDIDAAREVDWCACCAPRPWGVRLGAGKARARARALGLAVDVRADLSCTLSYDDLPGVGGEGVYAGGLPTGLTVCSVEAVAGVRAEPWRELWVATVRCLEEEGMKAAEPAHEALWRSVWVAAARHVDDACLKGEKVVAAGMEDVEVEQFAKQAMRCEECFRELMESWAPFQLW